MKGRGIASVKRRSARHQNLPIGIYRADMYLRGGGVIKEGRIRATFKEHSKSFSITKYGEDEATYLAEGWRKSKVQGKEKSCRDRKL